jgi:hypothetical protein
MTPIGPALRENITIELDARREPSYVVIGDIDRAAYIFLDEKEAVMVLEWLKRCLEP